MEIAAPGQRPAQRQRFHAEIIVYLAWRGPRGADRYRLEEALWPGRQVKDGALRTAVSRTRHWLGEQPNGELWLPGMGADRIYRLADGVLFDWRLFQELRRRGEAKGESGVDDLRAALTLVRGAPLDGVDGPCVLGRRTPYAWLAESDIYGPQLVSAVVDTAHRLAQQCLKSGDTAGARWAVEQAWLADPTRINDEPWLDLLVAEHLDGHEAERRSLGVQLMLARGAEMPEDLEPKAFQVLNELETDGRLSTVDRVWPRH